MRLIDADALRESIITRQTEMSYEDARALTCVDNAHTIEPQSKKGVWIVGKDGCYCSECGSDFPSADYNFCPECGADMRTRSDVNA